MLTSERASNLWPHDLTDDPIPPHLLDAHDRRVCDYARHAKRYCNVPVYRDPRLEPHQPRRAVTQGDPI